MYYVDKPVLKIGRAPDNDIVLVDEARSVSRWHAAIRSQPDGPLYLEDLKSSNGTVLNGQPVKVPACLKPGDRVTIGAFGLLLCEESAEDERFSIQPGPVELDELHKKPELLPLTNPGLAPSPDFRHIELLYEIGMTLARSHSVDEVTTAAVELLFKIDQVHRATVMLWDERGGAFKESELRLRSGGGMRELPGLLDPANAVVSRTILNRVRQDNRPLLIRDVISEQILNTAASIMRAGIQSAFCSPLNFRGRFLGVLYADNLALPQAFSEADFRTFTGIAAQTGLALANAIAGQELLEREMERQALMRYLPPQVANLIMERGGASRLNGELQPVTVLYADIRGFTGMSERMDAREIVAMLREFFSVMSAEILDCNGTLDKFIGDCIMALFGAPVHSEQAVRDGLKAAILMQQRMQALNRVRAANKAPPIQIGVGLHCGPAVVGNIGSDDRVQYTAIGDTVNVASRLVSLAAASQIIVSENIVNAIPDYDGFEPLGEFELKGRAAKLRVHSVTWAARPCR